MGAIGIGVLIVLLFSRMWIGGTMMLVGVLGCAAIAGWPTAHSLAGVVAYGQTASYTMASLPMFVLMGSIIAISGLGSDLYIAARNWFGHIKGGLAMATVVACGAFAAVCGESTATAVTMGKIAFPEMRKYNYDERLAAGSIASGGTIGIMIPPSVSFILYGLITEDSIGHLFMAGVIPGVSQVLLYMIVIFIWGKIRPAYVPAAPKASWRDRRRSLMTIWPVILVFFIVFYGMYNGVFTPTECGAIGALAALVTSIALRRLNRKQLIQTIEDGMRTAALTFFIIIGAYFLMRFMALSHLPSALGSIIVGWQQTYNIPSLAIIGVIAVFYLICGMFLDVIACILLTLPIVHPVIVGGLGFDSIWWGVIMVRVIEMSMISPPFGLNLFVLVKAVDVDLKTLYKGVWPFLAGDVLHLIALIVLPQISLWLPAQMSMA
ncbi:MAG: TRAP transporter large permease [Clostridiales Family XIII bacterium]|nr:TRAP transporter large permease [Clostridiales Family XIII bacterium]